MPEEATKTKTYKTESEEPTIVFHVNTCCGLPEMSVSELEEIFNAEKDGTDLFFDAEPSGQNWFPSAKTFDEVVKIQCFYKESCKAIYAERCPYRQEGK